MTSLSWGLVAHPCNPATRRLEGEDGGGPGCNRGLGSMVTWTSALGSPSTWPPRRSPVWRPGFAKEGRTGSGGIRSAAKSPRGERQVGSRPRVAPSPRPGSSHSHTTFFFTALGWVGLG